MPGVSADDVVSELSKRTEVPIIWDEYQKFNEYYKKKYPLLDEVGFGLSGGGIAFIDSLRIGKDSNYSRNKRLQELAESYVKDFIVPHEEARTLIEFYNKKAVNENLNDFKKELDKYFDFLYEWTRRMFGWRSCMVECLVQNFSDEEIHRIFENEFKNQLNFHFLEEDTPTTVLKNTQDRKKTNQLIEYHINAFHKTKAEADKKYNKNNNGIFSKSNPGIFNERNREPGISDTNSTPEHGGASATHEPQSNMRLGT